MATDPRAESLRLLTSIDATLKALLLVMSEKRNDAPTSPQAASDADLDGQYGDETVKFSPRDWSGESFKGAKMSACPPEFLGLYADACDYFAAKNDERGDVTDKGVPKSTYDKRTARRARGWAARLRRGWQVPSGSPDTGGAASDEAGF